MITSRGIHLVPLHLERKKNDLARVHRDSSGVLLEIKRWREREGNTAGVARLSLGGA